MIVTGKNETNYMDSGKFYIAEQNLDEAPNMRELHPSIFIDNAQLVAGVSYPISHNRGRFIPIMIVDNRTNKQLGSSDLTIARPNDQTTLIVSEVDRIVDIYISGTLE